MSRIRRIADYDRAWGGIADAIFSGDSMEERAFRSDWVTLLLPGSFCTIDAEVFSALARFTRLCGDSFLLVDCAFTSFPDELPLEISIDIESLRHVGFETVYGHVDSRVFGSAGRWGALFSPEEFWALAAEGSTIEAFAGWLGGVEELQQQFLADLRAGEFGPPSSAAEYFRVVCRAIGWARVAERI
jgi:hypothetical protein